MLNQAGNVTILLEQMRGMLIKKTTALDFMEGC